jgi:hypothetical protein
MEKNSSGSANKKCNRWCRILSTSKTQNVDRLIDALICEMLYHHFSIQHYHNLQSNNAQVKYQIIFFPVAHE